MKNSARKTLNHLASNVNIFSYSEFLIFFFQKSGVDYGEDERIALFLQNEEFLSELRINQDFMNTLDQDVGEKVSGSTSSGGPDIDVFKERLRSMSKSKFHFV